MVHGYIGKHIFLSKNNELSSCVEWWATNGIIRTFSAFLLNSLSSSELQLCQISIAELGHSSISLWKKHVWLTSKNANLRNCRNSFSTLRSGHVNYWLKMRAEWKGLESIIRSFLSSYRKNIYSFVFLFPAIVIDCLVY